MLVSLHAVCFAAGLADYASEPPDESSGRHDQGARIVHIRPLVTHQRYENCAVCITGRSLQMRVMFPKLHLTDPPSAIHEVRTMNLVGLRVAAQVFLAYLGGNE